MSKCKEKALSHHTQNVLEHKYIKPIINNNTGLIKLDLPSVLQYLDKNYGKVASKEVKNKEAETVQYRS